MLFTTLDGAGDCPAQVRCIVGFRHPFLSASNLNPTAAHIVLIITERAWIHAESDSQLDAFMLDIWLPACELALFSSMPW